MILTLPKTMKKHLFSTSPILMAVFILSGCAANLLPKNLKDGIPESSHKKAKAILLESIQAQGYSNLGPYPSYEVTLTDTWKGFMGGMSKLWPQKKSSLAMKFSLNHFDGHVEYLDGREKGFQAAMVGGKYYVLGEDSVYHAEKPNKKVRFGIEAFKYLNEIALGLSKAEILGYKGEEVFLGKSCHVIFATWETRKSNKKYDQYVVYVNKETKMVEAIHNTVRQQYMFAPGSGSLYGTVVYSDYRNINGFLFPFKQTVFLLKPKKISENFVHQVIVDEVKMGDKDISELVLNK